MSSRVTITQTQEAAVSAEPPLTLHLHTKALSQRVEDLLKQLDAARLPPGQQIRLQEWKKTFPIAFFQKTEQRAQEVSFALCFLLEALDCSFNEAIFSILKPLVPPGSSVKQVVENFFKLSQEEKTFRQTASKIEAIVVQEIQQESLQQRATQARLAALKQEFFAWQGRQVAAEQDIAPEIDAEKEESRQIAQLLEAQAERMDAIAQRHDALDADLRAMMQRARDALNAVQDL